MNAPYRPHYFPDEAEMKQSRARYLDYLPPEGRILDLGSGRGEFLELLQKSGRIGQGVEIDPDLVEICRNEGFMIEHDDALSFLKRKTHKDWDAIFIGHLIEHLPAPAAIELLNMATDKLKPKGRLIILTPNPNFLPGRGSFWSDLTHLRPYPLDGLKSFLTHAGFRIVDCGVTPESKLRVDWQHPLGSLINLLRLFVLRLIMLEEYDGGEIFIVGERQ